MARVAADLHELGDLARQFGVRVGFEALAWGRHINDYRQAWEAVRQADHPHVGLILDSFHMLAKRLPVDVITEIPADRIVLVQTADAPAIEMDLLFLSRHYRCFPGQGDLPVAAMLRELDEIGYRGPISHEIFSDDFRASSTRRIALDGMRSFLWLDEQVRGRPSAPLPTVDGLEFIEFVDHPNQVGELIKMGIPFTHVDTSDSVEGWKARDIPSLGDIRSLGLITLGRFRSSTRGLAAKRRAVSISGGFAGRMALSAPTARPWASRGECRAACCAVEPAIGRYR